MAHQVRVLVDAGLVAEHDARVLGGRQPRIVPGRSVPESAGQLQADGHGRHCYSSSS